MTWIDGPAGSGKTTLIEQIVRSNRAKEIAALRIRTDASIGEPVFTEADERSPDVGRWARAGAWAAGTLRVPAGWPRDLFDALEACDNADHLYAADVWLVEGPVEWSGGLHDTLVFVTPPEDLPEGMRPGDIDEETGEEILDTFEIPDELGWKLMEILEKGLPSKQRKHWLRHELEGVADAHIVVVNAVHGEQPGAGRPPATRATAAGSEALAAISPANASARAAGRLVDELQRLWRNDSLHYEVFGTRQGRRTTVAARLPDQRDDGTRKAVAAIKRRWRDTFGHVSRSSLFDDDE